MTASDFHYSRKTIAKLSTHARSFLFGLRSGSARRGQNHLLLSNDFASQTAHCKKAELTEVIEELRGLGLIEVAEHGRAFKRYELVPLAFVQQPSIR